MNSLNFAATTPAGPAGDQPADQIANIGLTRAFLDSNFPLSEGSHGDVTQYRVYFDRLVAHLNTGRCVGLVRPAQFNDYGGDRECPSSILLSSSALEIELQL